MSSAASLNLGRSQNGVLGNGLNDTGRHEDDFTPSGEKKAIAHTFPPYRHIHSVSMTFSFTTLFFCPYWRGHQTSPTVVSLKGRLPQKLQSKSTLSCEIVLIQSVWSWFYKENEIKKKMKSKFNRTK